MLGCREGLGMCPGGAGRQGGSKAPGGRSWALRPAPVHSQRGERGLGAARNREAHGSKRAAILPSFL